MSHAGEAELKPAWTRKSCAAGTPARPWTRCRPMWTKPPARFGRPLPNAAEPLDAFHGLRLDNDFDSTRTGATASGGPVWSDVLYFELFNRSQFEAHLQQG